MGTRRYELATFALRTSPWPPTSAKQRKFTHEESSSARQSL
jgi:hypothetical protein